MARTGTAENQAANAQMAAIQQQQNDRLVGYQDKFAADQAKIDAGQNIGANPYQNPDYLRNQNMIAATTADAADNADKSNLESTTRRTGLNSASLGYTTADMSRNKVKAITDYMAGLNNQNYQNNLSWQQYLLGNDMVPAGVANTMFGNATTGRDASLKNLTDIGLASYGPVSSLIQGLGSAAGGFLSGMGGSGSSGGFAPSGPAFRGIGSGFPGCWIAAAVFDGWEDPRTILVWAWLNTEFVKRPIGKMVMDLYRFIGRPVAFCVRHSDTLKRCFKPLFGKALDRATDWLNEWSRVNAIRKIACTYS